MKVIFKEDDLEIEWDIKDIRMLGALSTARQNRDIPHYPLECEAQDVANLAHKLLEKLMAIDFNAVKINPLRVVATIFMSATPGLTTGKLDFEDILRNLTDKK